MPVPVPVVDDVGSGGGLDSSVVVMPTTVKPVLVDTPSAPVTVLVIFEVTEVVLLEVAEGAAVVDPLSEAEVVVGPRVDWPVDEVPEVTIVEGVVRVEAAEVVEAGLRFVVVVVFACRFANLTCLNLAPL